MSVAAIPSPNVTINISATVQNVSAALGFPGDYDPKLFSVRFIKMRGKTGPSMMEIARQVAHAHGVKLEEMLGDRRHAYLIPARQEAMYHMVQEDRWSLPHIGRFFGRDHTTVMWGHARHARRLLGITKAQRVAGISRFAHSDLGGLTPAEQQTEQF
jgi:hypothetical protein